jgi:valyl-tRNA synthetase
LKSASKAEVVVDNADLISLLTKVERLDILPLDAEKPSRCLTFVTGEWELFFPVGELLDADKEVARLRGELEKLDKDIERARLKLSNENFVGRAPADVVQKEREALLEAESRRKRIEENIAGLE